MSLLMDALKRAQQANKRGPSAGQSQPVSPLTLEPVQQQGSMADPSAPPAKMPKSPLPALPGLETLDDEFLAHVRQPALRSKTASSGHAAPHRSQLTPEAIRAAPGSSNARPLAATETNAGPNAVRNAFAVKRAAAPGRSLLLTVMLVTALAASAIGTYFWLQLRPVTGLAAKAPAVSGVAQTAPAVPTPTVAAAPPNIPAPLPTRTRQTSAKDTSRAAIAAEPPAKDSHQARIDAGMAPIRISKFRSTQESMADEAYVAFQGGDIARATVAYGKLLDHDPRSIDALHGLAAIALREGRPDDAHAYYLRILELNPRDAIANANLIGSKGDTDPIASESRLKHLIAAQPDMPVLNFSLGNLYAGQGRWSEAQSAYFKAYSADSENPDYAFNLAISLDQLHQTKLAKQYYEQALKSSENRFAGFDRNLVLSRLRELQH